MKKNNDLRVVSFFDRIVSKEFDSESLIIDVRKYLRYTRVQSNSIESLLLLKERMSDFYDVSISVLIDEIYSLQESKSDIENQIIDTDDRLFTVKELCEYLQVTRPTINTYEKNGLRYFQVGRKGLKRYRKSDVDGFFEKK
jgi:excisionase family DNA binding protein